MMASLIMLCASHIDGEERLLRFRKMLKSVAGQVVHVPLFISVSTIDNAFKNDILLLAKKYIEFVFFVQDDKLSQFQHYNFLAQAALSYNPETTWCMFTDDDDVSYCTRTAVFLHHIANSSNNICVVKDTAVRTQYEIEGTISDKGYDTSHEYITHACRLLVLQEFCKRASNEILTQVGCDMIFNVWLMMQRINTFHNSHSLYEYTIRPDANTCRFQAYSERNMVNLDWLL